MTCRAAAQGAITRPGAPFTPASVWQLLQSPAVSDPAMTRSFVPFVTFTLNGGTILTFDEKFQKAMRRIGIEVFSPGTD